MMGKNIEEQFRIALGKTFVCITARNSHSHEFFMSCNGEMARSYMSIKEIKKMCTEIMKAVEHIENDDDFKD